MMLGELAERVCRKEMKGMAMMREVLESVRKEEMEPFMRGMGNG